MTTKTKNTEEIVKLPVELTPATPPSGSAIIVVGAGGTGARVIPSLIKLMRRGDKLIIIDHDVVEDVNLIRQHFTARDIGKPKAEVAAQRVSAEANRIGVEVQALVGKVDASWAGYTARLYPQTIFLGCVDNNAARIALHTGLEGLPHAWIDAGNDRRSGQVVMTLMGWDARTLSNGEERINNTVIYMDTLKRAYPKLLGPDPVETTTDPNCVGALQRVIGDTQTLAANQMAASLMINMVTWLLDELPFSLPVLMFSTLGTVSGRAMRIANIGSRPGVLNSNINQLRIVGDEE